MFQFQIMARLGTLILAAVLIYHLWFYVVAFLALAGAFHLYQEHKKRR